MQVDNFGVAHVTWRAVVGLEIQVERWRISINSDQAVPMTRRAMFGVCIGFFLNSVLVRDVFSLFVLDLGLRAACVGHYRPRMGSEALRVEGVWKQGRTWDTVCILIRRPRGCSVGHPAVYMYTVRRVGT